MGSMKIQAPGIDNVPPEVLKEDLDVTIELLHPLFVKIWRTGVVPDDWKKGLLVKLPKKGDVTNCKNWRGITLLSVTSRILSRLVLNRVKICIEERLRREQAGYQSKRSCIDQINILRIIIEQSVEYVANLYLLCVDFEKALDFQSCLLGYTAV
jgi:hypothetical protein